MKFLFWCLFFSLSLAQSFTGTYSVTDSTSGLTLKLKIIENPDQSLSGNFFFDTTPVMVSGKVTASGQANATLLDESGGFAFTLTLTEPQIILKASDTGDEIVLTRESSDAPELLQIDVSAPSTSEQQAQVTDTTFSDDSRFQECLAVIEDESSNPQKVSECQTYINSVLSQSNIEEGIGTEDAFDPEELSYCQEFLADAAAAKEDPDEASYCQSYVEKFATQTNGSTTTPTTFAGTFRGQDIALILQGEGPYTGTLEFQGKSYPVKASAQKNMLKGTFEVNGTNFEFTARLDGTALTLESGGQRYPMLKAPTN